MNFSQSLEVRPTTRADLEAPWVEQLAKASSIVGGVNPAAPGVRRGSHFMVRCDEDMALAESNFTVNDDPEIAAVAGGSAVEIKILGAPFGGSPHMEEAIHRIVDQTRGPHHPERVTLHLRAGATEWIQGKGMSFSKDSGLSIREVPTDLGIVQGEAHRYSWATPADSHCVSKIFETYLKGLSTKSTFINPSREAVMSVYRRVASIKDFGKTADNSVILLARDGDSVLGVIECSLGTVGDGSLISKLPVGAEVLSIDWIAVTPDSQGRRIGHHLVREVVRRTVTPKTKYLMAQHLVGPGTAQGFWESQGFVLTWEVHEGRFK
ncbi:GNAT family N-acetyltransferase [Arthrobacter sp. UYEF3]|uniref:GNAT family N-acetyltransferase n=1 Tax=Arthrobacter sp. UYEF3 TaxID=1756365 RepID=UPI003390BA98